jgi:hypothetical protein
MPLGPEVKGILVVVGFRGAVALVRAQGVAHRRGQCLLQAHGLATVQRAGEKRAGEDQGAQPRRLPQGIDGGPGGAAPVAVERQLGQPKAITDRVDLHHEAFGLPVLAAAGPLRLAAVELVVQDHGTAVGEQGEGQQVVMRGARSGMDADQRRLAAAEMLAPVDPVPHRPATAGDQTALLGLGDEIEYRRVGEEAVVHGLPATRQGAA